MTINQGSTQADPTHGGPIVFDIVFSEPVSGFSTGDVTLSGTAGATTAIVSGSAVALLTVVVSIFYFDSTLLPPVVRDLLAMILGA